MSVSRRDIFQVPHTLVDFNEELIPILNRNFQEIERQLAKLQMYEKTTGKLVNTEFAGRNDRIAVIPTDPVIAADGTAVDHTLNADGSANISLEWVYDGSDDAHNVDGFVIHIHVEADGTPYTFGTNAASEQVYYVTPDKRAFIVYGLSPEKWYTFGIQAYRGVDQDIASGGRLQSNTVKPTYAGEDPYRPTANPAFAGDVTGTVGGTLSSAIAILPTRVDALDSGFLAMFDGLAGHKHDGVDGNGPPVSKIAANATTPTGGKVWTADNDGPDSGLEADKLDGKHLAEVLALLAGSTQGGYGTFSKGKDSSEVIVIPLNRSDYTRFQLIVYATWYYTGLSYSYIGACTAFGGTAAAQARGVQSRSYGSGDNTVHEFLGSPTSSLVAGSSAAGIANAYISGNTLRFTAFAGNNYTLSGSYAWQVFK